MLSWWRKPDPATLRPEPAQLADAIDLWRRALEIADGDDRRARQVALRLLQARRYVRRQGRRAS